MLWLGAIGEGERMTEKLKKPAGHAGKHGWTDGLPVFLCSDCACQLHTQES